MASTHDYKPDPRNENIQIYVNGKFVIDEASQFQ